ncbi:hypothetical protein C6Y62_01455 [Hyphomicrobium sulfonivorans]|nr:hypothetical protein [Hyphomicrobium sulfonivorans]
MNNAVRGQAMQEAVKRRKKAVNLSIDAKLLAEAKEAGTNLSTLLEHALREQLKGQREDNWRKANKEALDAYDDHIRKDGLWSEEFRTW